MTQYTDDQGTTSASKTTTYIYGPYLRAVPPLPVGAKKGQSGIATATAATVGWLYDATLGTIKPNTTDTAPVEADVKGTLYSAY